MMLSFLPLSRHKAAFQKALLAWYRLHARPLPWREMPSLYRTVVSEFMLQQTQVRTVLPYFGRWMADLPDFASLAAAPEAKVLRLWEGLGYYSRARNLHKLARELAGRPAPPRTAESWLELPGVGPYTAAAVASIAFGAPTACVDGNVVRILARLTATSAPFRDSGTASRAFAPLAAQLLCAECPGDYNQAMMELGATVCFRQNPLCGSCPVRSFCAAASAGKQADLPRLQPRPTVNRSIVRVWCERRGALLLHRAGDRSRRLAGLRELPTPGEAGIAPAAARRGLLLSRKKRSITRYRITESIHAAPWPRGRLAAGLEWVRLGDLDAVAFSGPHRRWVREILMKKS